MSFSFSKDQRLKIDGMEYVVQLTTAFNQCQLVSEAGELMLKSLQELLSLYSEGRLRGVSASQAITMVGRELIDLDNIPDVDALDKEAIKEAVLKHKCVKHLVESGQWTCTPSILNPLLEEFFTLYGSGCSFKRTVMYEAHRKYINSAGDWRAQLPQHFRQGNRRKRYPEEIYVLTQDAIESVYLTKQQRSIADAYRHLQLQIYQINKSRDKGCKLPVPGVNFLHRKLKSYRHFDVVRHRRGHLEARREHPSGNPVPRATRPLEVVEIDHTPADIILIDGTSGQVLGRPTLTIAVDEFTTCIVGIYVSFSPGNLDAVLACFRHACLPKQLSSFELNNDQWPMHGIPRALLCDNGAEFHAKGLDYLSVDLGFEVPYCGSGQPQQKGTVERTFKTLNAGLLHSLPGTTHSNYEAAGAYQPEKQATITFERFMTLLVGWICKDYHVSPSRSDGKTPLEVWQESAGVTDIRLPRDPVLLDRLMGKTEIYRLGKGPIIIDNIAYTSYELGELRRTIGTQDSVQVRYFDVDLSYVEVIHPITRQPIRVPAEDQAYTRNLSRYLHKLTRAQVRKDFKSKSTSTDLMEARLRSQELISESRSEAKRARRQAQMAKAVSSTNPSGKDIDVKVTKEESEVRFRWAVATDDSDLAVGFDVE